MTGSKKSVKASWLNAVMIIVPLLCGGGGVWGVMKYVVERPMREQQERLSREVHEKENKLREAQAANGQLEVRLKEAELDAQELTLTAENFKHRAEALVKGIEIARARGRQEAAENLSQQLEETMLAMDQRLSFLQKTLETKRVTGQGWFQDSLRGDRGNCSPPDLNESIITIQDIRGQVSQTRDALGLERQPSGPGK